MQEIRFHGRGGQGTVVASILLAKAYFKAGYYVQTFPLFGVERRGAPVEAYLRLDTKKILVRSNLYHPDHVIVQDARLLGIIDVTRGLKKNGLLLLNMADAPEDQSRFSGFRLAVVDATQIAIDSRLGTRTHPMVNTAMTGAFARIMNAPPLDALLETIETEITEKTGSNIQAAERAFHDVKML